MGVGRPPKGEPARARTSGYGYRETHSTQINDQNKTQPEKESGMSTKRMRKRRKD